MCSRLPVHIPGNCPPVGLVVPAPGFGGVDRKAMQERLVPKYVLPQGPSMREVVEEYQRVQEVKRRYPPGPWPFQRTTGGSGR